MLVFVILRVIPGDPAKMLLPEGAPQSQVEELNRHLGLREPLEPNDVLLVCSDGLWGGLDDGEIGGAFPPARAPLREELQRLAERSVAVVGAGSDNTSAAVVRWIGNS